MFRTLVRLIYVDYKEGAYFVVPGWEWRLAVYVHRRDLPESIIKAMDNGQVYFHARVNLGAESYEDLDFNSWEVG